jgi:hypothetical protein
MLVHEAQLAGFRNQAIELLRLHRHMAASNEFAKAPQDLPTPQCGVFGGKQRLARLFVGTFRIASRRRLPLI